MALNALAGESNRTIVRTSSAAAPYPADLLGTVCMRDGTVLRARPIRPDDEPRLVELFHRLTARTVYQRFHAPFHRLPAAWYHEFANVDYESRLALVAEDLSVSPSAIRAVARWEPGEDPGVSEIAMVVEDGWQDRGLGTRLLEALIAAAEARGIHRFAAEVLADNARMLRVIRRVGVIRRGDLSHGVLSIEFERSPGPDPA